VGFPYCEKLKIEAARAVLEENAPRALVRVILTRTLGGRPVPAILLQPDFAAEVGDGQAAALWACATAVHYIVRTDTPKRGAATDSQEEKHYIDGLLIRNHNCLTVSNTKLRLLHVKNITDFTDVLVNLLQKWWGNFTDHGNFSCTFYVKLPFW
jgi:hypothetical protein